MERSVTDKNTNIDMELELLKLLHHNKNKIQDLMILDKFIPNYNFIISTLNKQLDIKRKQLISNLSIHETISYYLLDFDSLKNLNTVVVNKNLKEFCFIKNHEATLYYMKDKIGVLKEKKVNQFAEFKSEESITTLIKATKFLG